MTSEQLRGRAVLRTIAHLGVNGGRAALDTRSVRRWFGSVAACRGTRRRAALAEALEAGVVDVGDVERALAVQRQEGSGG